MSGCLGSVLAALVDGELDHAAREKAQRHLAHCDVCRAEVEAQRRLKASLTRLDPALPSNALLARLAGISEVPPVEPLPVAPRVTWRPHASAALGPRTVRAGAPADGRLPLAVPASWTTPPTTQPAGPPAAQAPGVPSVQPTGLPSGWTSAPPATGASAVAASATGASAVGTSAVAAPAVGTSATGRSSRSAPSALALALLRGSRTPPVPATSTRPAAGRPAARSTALRTRALVPRHRAAAAGSAFAMLGVAAALALAAPPPRPASTPVGPVQGAFVSDVTGGPGARSGGTLGAGLTSASTVRPETGTVVSRPAVPVRAVVATVGRSTAR